MHEFSLMSQLVVTVLNEAEKHDLAKVEEVQLEIGSLAFIGQDQLSFAYQVLSGEHPILKNSKLTMTDKEVVIKCLDCNYKGGMEYKEENKNNPVFHRNIPTFSCPKCKGKVDIIEGRDCIISNIIGLTKDEV